MKGLSIEGSIEFEKYKGDPIRMAEKIARLERAKKRLLEQKNKLIAEYDQLLEELVFLREKSS
jgi:hypothetical protein